MTLKPSGKPNGKPTGTPESAFGHGGDKNRSIHRQNEAARALAYMAYRVENDPTVKKSDFLGQTKDNPDYRIEGRIFDCYAPVNLLPANPLIWKAESGKGDIGKRMQQIVNLYQMGREEQRWNGTFDAFDDSISDTSVYTAYRAECLEYSLAKIRKHVEEKVSAKQAFSIVLNLADSGCNAQQICAYIDKHPIEDLRHLLVLEPRGDAEIETTYKFGSETCRIHKPDGFRLTSREYEQALDPGDHASKEKVEESKSDQGDMAQSDTDNGNASGSDTDA